MIGPLTLRIGKAVQDCVATLGSKVAAVLDNSPRSIQITMPTAPILGAAYAVSKGDWAHPRILWGKCWFVYYQAWLWRYSRRWREYIVEVWLRELDDKDDLEQLLVAYVEAFSSLSQVAACNGTSVGSGEGSRHKRP